MSTLPTSPAPWKLTGIHAWHTDEVTGMGFRFRVIQDSRGHGIAWVADDEGCEDGDGQLLAAAPDLLAACKFARYCLEQLGYFDPDSIWEESKHQLQAAITKTETTK